MNAQRTIRMILPGLLMRSHEEVRERIYRRITKRYGGVTTWRGLGWWKSGASHQVEGLVHESIVVCECAVSSWNTEDYQFWNDQAHYARKHLHQEAIMFSVREESSWLIDSDDVEIGRRLKDANVSDSM